MIYIESQRLRMSQIRSDHWSLFLRLHQDKAVIRYAFDRPEVEEIRMRFDARLPEWNWGDEHWLCLVISDKFSGQWLGVTGLQISEDGSSVEIGYLLLEEFHGKGFGTESLLALVNHIEHYFPVMEIRAIVTEGNLACCRILEKAHFKLENTEPLAFQIGGEWYDDLIYCYQVKRRH